MKIMKPYLLLLFWVLAASSLKAAELTIEITKGADNPVPVAVVPFSWSGAGELDDVARIIEDDLRTSGQFKAVSRDDMIAEPNSSEDVFYRDWRAIGVDYLVVGQVSRSASGKMRVRYELLDANQQRRIAGGTRSDSADNIRGIAHFISDRVYEKLTNIRGAFNTKLLYVSARRESGQFRYRLLTSDIDGAREKVLLDSPEPIMTPSWSPDGKRIAYVSFEGTRPGIYIHDLRSNKRRQLTNFRGINGSPAWSPDGKKLAMVLSKDGSPDIYVMDVASRELKRVTHHFAIDTEPSWMPDGKSLIFTSDRGGKPQIYRLSLASGQVSRITFEGDYNARGRLLPGGNGLVMVHRNKGQYHIALQDLERGTFEVLTNTDLDESPSVAPNGAIMLYATKHKGRGVLAAVSLDGSIHYRLPSRYGDVREPAWSPYLD